MSDIRSLEQGIQERQDDLRGLVLKIGREGYKLQRNSNIVKVATIILSAVTTAKGVADSIYPNSHTSLVIFTLIGIVTTVALGFEGSFKMEKRAAELTLLSASAQATLIRVDSEWRKTIGSVDNTESQASAARSLLSVQDAKLEEVHQKAATNGIHLTYTPRAFSEITAKMSATGATPVSSADGVVDSGPIPAAPGDAPYGA